MAYSAVCAQCGGDREAVGWAVLQHPYCQPCATLRRQTTQMVTALRPALDRLVGALARLRRLTEMSTAGVVWREGHEPAEVRELYRWLESAERDLEHLVDEWSVRVLQQDVKPLPSRKRVG